MPKSNTADTTSGPTDDALRQRAYYLWEADGRPDGQSDHYWHLAHAEATQAMIEKTADAVARVSRGKNPLDPPPAVKAKLKSKSEDAKAPRKATPKPRAAVRKAN